MGDDTAFELERRVSGIVGIGLVRFAVLVDALGNVRSAEAAYGLHFPEQVVEHVTPMAEHIQNNAAVLGPAIVPARPLRRLAPVALEHSIAELAAYREHAAEKARLAEHSDLAQSGQEQLVLD